MWALVVELCIVIEPHQTKSKRPQLDKYVAISCNNDT